MWRFISQSYNPEIITWVQPSRWSSVHFMLDVARRHPNLFPPFSSAEIPLPCRSLSPSNALSSRPLTGLRPHRGIVTLSKRALKAVWLCNSKPRLSYSFHTPVSTSLLGLTGPSTAMQDVPRLQFGPNTNSTREVKVQNTWDTTHSCFSAQSKELKSA